MKHHLSSVITTLFVTGLLLAGSAMAQGGHDRNRGDGFGGPPGAVEKLARMSNRLGLTPEQESAMLLVLQEHEQDRAALDERVMELIGPEVCANRQHTEDQILTVLTAEQAELFQEQKQQRQERAGERSKRKDREPLDCSVYEGTDG